MKSLDTQLLLTQYAHLICDEGARDLPLLISGNSMSPFLIHNRDTVYLSPITAAPRRGDMILYRRENGQFVLHRVCAIRKTGFAMAGDAQSVLEEGVRRQQMVAIVTAATRKGKNIGPGSFWWEFFAKVWCRMLPLRRLLRRSYEFWKK